MEIFYILLLSFFMIFLSFALHVLFFRNKSGSSGRLPPGKTGWPVIGETIEFLSTGWKGHPEKFIFDRMAKFSSRVFKTHLLGEKAVVLCGAAGNKFLFSNENKIVEARWSNYIVKKMFPSTRRTSQKEEVIKMRKMLPNFLKPEALQRYIGIMDHMAQIHFSSCWENKDQVQVFHLCKKYTFAISSRIFLSVEEPSEVAKLLEPFDVLASGLISVPIDLPGTPFNKGIKASNHIRKLLVEIMQQRKIELADGKAVPTQDIMTHMLATSDENGEFMLEIDVANTVILLLVGSHDTTSSACTSIVRYLADLPEIYEQVYKEQMEIANSKAPGEFLNWKDIQKMKYSWNVACEVLRLAPPLQGSFRVALTDFTFGGFTVPKGWKIFWSVNSTQRNPEFFSEPLKFDPTRFEGSGPEPFTFIPFGGGPRMCPGVEYARLEILVFMHNLVKRFKWEKVFADEKFVVNPTPIPSKGLPVRLYAHKK